MKPLYMVADGPARMRLDGPSLLVTAEGMAARRYPLRGVSRVVVGGNLDLTVEAVAEILNRGITIAVVGPGGLVRGCAIPWKEGLPSRNGERIRELLERADGLERYRDWVRAEGRQALLGALRRLCLRPPDLRPAVARAFLDVAVGGGSEAGARAVRRRVDWLETALASRVAGWMAGLALDTSLLSGGGDGAGLPLVRDFCAVLGWQHYVDLAGRGEGLEEAEEERADWRRAVLQMFELQEERDLRRIETQWRRFLVWIGQVVTGGRGR